MNLYELYEADNSFEGEEGIFYIIAGQGGSARRSNNHKYYIITQSIAGIYNADEDCEISFSTPEEFAAALSDRLKYICQMQERLLWKMENCYKTSD